MISSLSVSVYVSFCFSLSHPIFHYFPCSYPFQTKECSTVCHSDIISVTCPPSFSPSLSTPNNVCLISPDALVDKERMQSSFFVYKAVFPLLLLAVLLLTMFVPPIQPSPRLSWSLFHSLFSFVLVYNAEIRLSVLFCFHVLLHCLRLSTFSHLFSLCYFKTLEDILQYAI